jgi:hypothetical protein
MRYLANSTLTDDMEGGGMTERMRERERERERERKRERERERERERGGELCSLFFTPMGNP